MIADTVVSSGGKVLRIIVSRSRFMAGVLLNRRLENQMEMSSYPGKRKVIEGRQRDGSAYFSSNYKVRWVLRFEQRCRKGPVFM